MGSGTECDPIELDAFTDSLQHRGPDGRGTYIDAANGIGLGHRRLAVIDLSVAGEQPMQGPRGTWITFNGEIYNYRELRQELEDLGHHFKSQTDTEVLLAAYTEWGSECQQRLNGMWAFAIWDPIQRELFLSRDRFGVKPLFLLTRGKDVYFASELKAFRHLRPDHRPSIDESVVASMSDVESGTRTLLEGVRNIKAGHQVVLRSSGSSRIERWWRTSSHLVEVPTNFHDQVDEYRELLDSAAALRTRSDVPLGSAVSGGLDSSAVVASVVGQRKQLTGARLPYDAFTIDYVKSAHSEIKYARELCAGLNVPLEVVPVDSSSVGPEELTRIIYSLESIHDPAIGPWRLYERMRQRGVVVSIDGHGPDEALGGYHDYARLLMEKSLAPWARAQFQEGSRVLRGMTSSELPDGFTPALDMSRGRIASKSIRTKLRRLRSQGVMYGVRALGGANGAGYRYARNLIHSISPGRLQERWIQVPPADIDRLREVRLRSKDPLGPRLYSDFHYDVLPSILAKFDRMSMAHGIEVRSPFLDWRVVTFSFSLATSSLMRDGFSKAVLRESVRGRIPESIRLRRSKIGFASPMQSWFSESIGEFVRDTVSSEVFQNSSVWNGPAIRRDLDVWMARGDYGNAVRVWPYVQSAILIDALQST